jgi:hypothetical protein
MSSYDPPNEIPLPPIFNPINWVVDNIGITTGQADIRYIKKAGDTATGVINFASGLLTNDGSNLSASHGFINQSNVGLYRIGASQLGISVGGVKQLDLSTTLALFTNPLQVPSGSVGTTAVQVGATNVGLYSSAVNTLNVSTNGVNRLGIDTSTITSTLPIQVPSTSTIANCGLQVGLANTGLQYNAGVLYFGLGGTIMMRYQAAQIYSSTPHNFTNGSAAAPAICAGSYQTTGLYWTAGPVLNITTGGTQRCNFSSTAVQLNGVPLDCNNQNVKNAPQVGNEAGNLELRINSTGAGGTLTLTGGTGLLSGTAGGSSGQHLVLSINGTQYKIALLNI